MSTEADEDRQVVVLLHVVADEEDELIGQQRHGVLLGEHTHRNEVGKEAQVDAQFACVDHLSKGVKWKMDYTYQYRTVSAEMLMRVLVQN